jgi:hypothetical protein
MQPNHRLSKSKILSGLQCHKRLWLEAHRRDLAKHSARTQKIFRRGHAFGERARILMGEGELVGHTHDIPLALEDTKTALARALSAKSMVYEAAFCFDDVVARADGFEPCDDGWHMIEVKAAAVIKPYFLRDCAIQAWVADGAGYPVKKITLTHIDGSATHAKTGAAEGPLKYVDITSRAEPLKSNVAALVREYREILSSAQPDIRLGSQCSTPFECPFIDHCRGVQAQHASVALPGAPANAPA